MDLLSRSHSPWPFCIENYPSDQRLSHDTYSQTFIYLCALSKTAGGSTFQRKSSDIFARAKCLSTREREKAIVFPPSFLDFTSTSSGLGAHCQGLLRNMFLVASQVSAASAGGVGVVGVNVFPPPRSSILFASFPPAVSSFAASTWCVPGGRVCSLAGPMGLRPNRREKYRGHTAGTTDRRKAKVAAEEEKEEA